MGRGLERDGGRRRRRTPRLPGSDPTRLPRLRRHGAAGVPPAPRATPGRRRLRPSKAARPRPGAPGARRAPRVAARGVPPGQCRPRRRRGNRRVVRRHAPHGDPPPRHASAPARSPRFVRRVVSTRRRDRRPARPGGVRRHASRRVTRLRATGEPHSWRRVSRGARLRTRGGARHGVRVPRRRRANRRGTRQRPRHRRRRRRRRRGASGRRRLRRRG